MRCYVKINNISKSNQVQMFIKLVIKLADVYTDWNCCMKIIKKNEIYKQYSRKLHEIRIKQK